MTLTYSVESYFRHKINLSPEYSIDLLYIPHILPDANAIPIPKAHADEAMDAASCIGCGACAAACKNGSAMLFVSAKVSQLALLPQGKVEAAARAKAMVAKMDELGFGNCTNTGACAAECPKQVSLANIARLNREFLCAKLKD